MSSRYVWERGGTGGGDADGAPPQSPLPAVPPSVARPPAAPTRSFAVLRKDDLRVGLGSRVRLREMAQMLDAKREQNLRPGRGSRHKIHVRADAPRKRDDPKTGSRNLGGDRSIPSRQHHQPNVKPGDDTAAVSHLQAFRLRSLCEQQSLLHHALSDQPAPASDDVATPVLRDLKAKVRSNRRVLCDYLLAQQSRKGIARAPHTPTPPGVQRCILPRSSEAEVEGALVLAGPSSPRSTVELSDELTDKLLQDLVAVKSENLGLLTKLLQKESWAVEMQGRTQQLQEEKHTRLKDLEAVVQQEREKYDVLRIAYDDQAQHNKNLSRELYRIKQQYGTQGRISMLTSPLPQEALSGAASPSADDPQLVPLQEAGHLELRSQILQHTYHALDETKSAVQAYRRQITDLKDQNKALHQRIAKADEKLATTRNLLRARKRHADAEERLLEEDATGIAYPPPDSVPVTSTELLRYTPRPEYPKSLTERHGIRIRHKATSSIFEEVVAKLEGKALEVTQLEDRLLLMSSVSGITEDYKKSKGKPLPGSGPIGTFGLDQAPVGFLETAFKSVRNKCWTRCAAFSYITNAIEAAYDMQQALDDGLSRVVVHVARTSLVAVASIVVMTQVVMQQRLKKRQKKRGEAPPAPPAPPEADAKGGCDEEVKARWQRIMNIVHPNYTLCMLHRAGDTGGEAQVPEGDGDGDGDGDEVDTQSQASSVPAVPTVAHDEFYRLEVVDSAFSRSLSRWLMVTQRGEDTRVSLAYNLYHHAQANMKHDPMCALFVFLSTRALPLQVFADVREVLACVKCELSKHASDTSVTVSYEACLLALKALFGGKSPADVVRAQCAMRSDFGGSVPRVFSYGECLDLTEKLSEFGRHCVHYAVSQHQEIYLAMEMVLRGLTQPEISLPSLQALLVHHFQPSNHPFSIPSYLAGLQSMHELKDGSISLPLLLYSLRLIPLTITDGLRVPP